MRAIYMGHGERVDSLHYRLQDRTRLSHTANCEGFADRWNWDSAVTRRTILGLIQRERRVRKLLNEGRTAWWDEGGRMGWRNWMRELSVGEEWVWGAYVG